MKICNARAEPFFSLNLLFCGVLVAVAVVVSFRPLLPPTKVVGYPRFYSRCYVLIGQTLQQESLKLGNLSLANFFRLSF